jgi:arylsulfatase A-like enzyme
VWRTVAGVATLLTVAVALAGGAGAGALLLGRLRAPRAARLAAYAAGGAALAHVVLERNLQREADRALDGAAAAPIYVALVILVGASLPVVHSLGALASSRPRLRAAAIAVAIAGAGLNHAFFRDDYHAIHGVVGALAGLLAGAAAAPIVLRALAARPGLSRGVAVAVAALAVGPLVVGVPNAVRKELFRSPGAAGAWALAMTHWDVLGLPPAAAPARGARFYRAPRPEDPPIPPTALPLSDARAPVVVFVTIDALRADVLADRARDARWPALARIRDESAWFRRARSAGSQTAVSLTSAFSGRTFSELFWARYGRGATRFEYAAADPTPRLAAILDEEGIATLKIVGTNFLANEFGTAAGFAREIIASEGRRHARAREIEGPLLDELRRVPREPAFFYAHFMEPHAPYDRGALKEGSKKERYLSEIAALDGTLERLVAVLDGPRLRNRSWLVLSSDHGEAFGEHDTWEHTKTLYEELIRVPLLVRGPGVVPRAIDEPVSVLDVGPTVLDVFRLPIPAGWTGESLVPLLRGDDVALERPILAEGRLRRAIVAPDGMKVIVDLRRQVVEAYDLSRDPGELDDVWDDGDPEARARARLAAAALEAYYEAREARAPGYRRVYKP